MTRPAHPSSRPPHRAVLPSAAVALAAVVLAGCGASHPARHAVAATTTTTTATTTTLPATTSTAPTTSTTAAPPTTVAPTTTVPGTPTSSLTPAQLAADFEPLDPGQACPDVSTVLPARVTGGPLLAVLGNHSVHIAGVISGPQLLVATPGDGPHAGQTLLLAASGDEYLLDADQLTAVRQQEARHPGTPVAAVTVPEQSTNAYQLICASGG